MTTTTAQSNKSAILSSLRNQQPHPMFANRSRTSSQPARRSEVKTMQQSAPMTPHLSYAEVDAMVNTVAPGRYALRRAQATEAGNTVTFFKVFETRRGNRIVQLIANGGMDYTEQALPLKHQWHAARHIAEDRIAALELYGQETGTCGDCGRALSDETSRRIGRGPICRNK